LLYRSDVVMAEALVQARSHELLPAAAHLCSFLEASTDPGRRGPTPALSHR
jgi:UDP-N-acetylglucosamine acyltransferase